MVTENAHDALQRLRATDAAPRPRWAHRPLLGGVSWLVVGCFEPQPLSEGRNCFGECHEPRCGDGLVEHDEECDEGSENDDETPGACRSDCTLPYCGDGIRDPEEACDEGEKNGQPGDDAKCTEDCTIPDCGECGDESDSGTAGTCGDGVLDDDEDCDGEPNCGVDCRVIECGDGRVDEGEECDGGEDCTERCQRIACGNNRIDDGVETCEPPGVGRCGADCRLIQCGDGITQAGEECDPPSEGVCSTTCQDIECGNARIDEGEGCDPPRSGECDERCRPLGCGDGRVTGNEECDPPASDRCDGQCRVIECGNSRLEENEQCDPPVWGTCSDECRDIVCGDGILADGEECDPPAAGTCSGNCLFISCGNGRVDDGEQCDPMADMEGSCSQTCAEIDTSTGTELLYGFDTDLQGWYIRETSPASLEGDARLTHDAQNGSQTPGVARLHTPFTDSNQKIELQVDRSLDLAGRTLTLRVRLHSGLSADAEHPGGIKLFAKSGSDYRYASGAWVELHPGAGWSDVTLVGDAPILDPEGYAPADVRQVGFELRSFEETEDVSDAVLFFDTMTLHD